MYLRVVSALGKAGAGEMLYRKLNASGAGDFCELKQTITKVTKVRGAVFHTRYHIDCIGSQFGRVLDCI